MFNAEPRASARAASGDLHRTRGRDRIVELHGHGIARIGAGGLDAVEIFRGTIVPRDTNGPIGDVAIGIGRERKRNIRVIVEREPAIGGTVVRVFGQKSHAAGVTT